MIFIFFVIPIKIVNLQNIKKEEQKPYFYTKKEGLEFLKSQGRYGKSFKTKRDLKEYLNARERYRGRGKKR